MRYRRDVTKIVYGWEECEADNKEEAKKKFEEGDCDEFDNKNDNTYGEITED